MSRAAVITIGCRLNQSEGDALRTWLRQQGNEVVAKVCYISEDAENSPANRLAKDKLDTVFINTCAVTERAARTSLKWIRRFINLRPKPKLIVTGCLAEIESERIRQIKGVDEVISQTAKVKMIEQCPILPSRARAFLKIQDGCLNHCAFCLPSQIRGQPVSKPISTVKQEVMNLVADRYQEIVLTGLNLGTYGFDIGTSLVKLLATLAKIKGDFRIRLGCLEPDVFDELILARFSEFRLCSHFHIPLQSGDDRILRLMRRKYNIGQYARLIERIVNLIPEINIGTDLITGFPGEDNLSFERTLNFLAGLPFGYFHVFPYSPRLGTEAFIQRETVNSKEKKERVNRLRTLSRRKSLNYRQRFLNKTLEVVTEPKPWVMADNYIRIFIDSNYNGKGIGKLANAKVTKVTIDRTFGELI